LKQFKTKKMRENLVNVGHINYFGSELGSSILNYIQNKDSIKNSLSKWLVFSFPNFGYYLAQYCSEHLNWNKKSITDWVSNYANKDRSSMTVKSETVESVIQG